MVVVDLLEGGGYGAENAHAAQRLDGWQAAVAGAAAAAAGAGGEGSRNAAVAVVFRLPLRSGVRVVALLEALYEVVGRAGPRAAVVPLFTQKDNVLGCRGPGGRAGPALGDYFRRRGFRVEGVTVVGPPAPPADLAEAFPGVEVAAAAPVDPGPGAGVRQSFEAFPAEGPAARPKNWEDGAVFGDFARDAIAGRYHNVAVGGTFDRLHAGHRLLLAAAALACDGKVWLGITTDAMLSKKERRAMIADYATREVAAKEFLLDVNPSIEVLAGELHPVDPPGAATLPEMDALVVSLETVQGAEWIQGVREGNGLAPLRVVTVGLLGGGAEGEKLSSSGLREAEAEAAA